MRKTLFAMLGLVALGLWAMPTLAAVSNDPQRDLPKVSEPIPLENRPGIWQDRLNGGYQGSLSGALIKQSQAPTTTWYLYPGACTDRANGTWAPRTSPQADSLNGYTPGSTGPYGVLDQSLSEIMWHIADDALCTPNTNCPPILSGHRMLWCGHFDPNGVQKIGYPNLTYQILYVDTGAHLANYNLTMDYNFSCEFNYDAVYLIAAGGDAVDPIGNSRAQCDAQIAAGTELILWTGSITPATANATGANTTSGQVLISDNPGAPATVTGASFTIDQHNRALYFVFKSDCLCSPGDGCWKEGAGQLMDNVSTNDNGPLYSEQAAAGGTDGFSGNVLVGTPSNPVISARVPPGVGTLWQLVAGLNLPTPDTCLPKSSSTDLVFEGGNASTFHTVPNQFNSVVGCTFPIPTGVASVLALWDEYLDLPQNQGYVQYSEFRTFRGGSWGAWDFTTVGGGVVTGALQAWGQGGDQLGAATQADSVQIRYNMQCIPFFAADHNNCGDVIYGILYDNFRLELTTGVPAPLFGVFVGSIAQSTFVDGTMAGTGCNAATVTAGQCWPGVRGSDGGGAAAVHDNFNSPLGDSIFLAVVTGLRPKDLGINWHFGFDKTVNKGLTIVHTNPNFVPAFGAPAIIFRIFDPASKTWSPFDSSELDANNITIAAGDTTLGASQDAAGFRMNWPPRDRVGQSLPGGFSVNGKTLYSQLNFLPRGSKVQYYWKGVDLNGGTSYQFSSNSLAREVNDLPPLPGSGIIAPDIIEFDVLPSVYSTAGSAGTLVAGKTNTPLLDLDGSYTRWNFGAHATVQALKLMGVREDRYRQLQGLGEGGHIGGHEFAGTRGARLSNYFPNMDEYGIKDSLAGWYRIMIQSSHTATSAVDEDQDAKLIKQWWDTPTPGTDGGDRCIFASGDDYFNTLLAPSGVPHPNDTALATTVYGVAAVTNAWNGTGSVIFPTIKDLFADPAAGPALGSGSYAYQIDGGCPAPNRFDALTKVGSAEAQNSATYPTFASVTNVAGVSYMTERDVLNDHDRNKALGYGFSIQFIRQGGENLLDNRAQVLYKFLTSCRGPRTVTDTASCWPCPTDANKYGNWAVLSGFNTSTFGPLYPIQNGNLAAAGVGPVASAPALNRIQGNFPNPFNPQTAIRFSSARAGKVDVRIFDVAGRLVQTISKNATQGVNEVRWNGQSSDGKNLASGVYFVKVKYPDGTESLNGLKIAIVR